MALAGVMGGEESEIAASTRAVLLESAWFEPVSIRRTSKSQGMHTEASHRFERGADIQMAPLALDRTAALIQEIAGGEILEGMIDVYPRPRRPPELRARAGARSRASWEQKFPEKKLSASCAAWSFRWNERTAKAGEFLVPSFRVDVSREVDLVEEVARHVGYDRLPSRVRPAPPRVERDTTRDKVMTTTSLLVGLGFHEIITSSMVDPVETRALFRLNTRCAR